MTRTGCSTSPHRKVGSTRVGVVQKTAGRKFETTALGHGRLLYSAGLAHRHTGTQAHRHTDTQAHEHGQCHVTFLGQGEVLGGSVVNDDMVDVETSFYN